MAEAFKPASIEKRILYFGMPGQFSFFPLQAVLRAGQRVSAVIIPAPSGHSHGLPRPVRRAPIEPDCPGVFPNIVSLALEWQIPVWQIDSLTKQAALDVLTSFEPDVICVACFSRILPAPVLALPRFGCLNLHPSLLPAYRGPEPLFWIAYHDEQITGVTLHRLDTGIDSGNIIGQRKIARRDGMPGSELERECAERGGELLVEALNVLSSQESLANRPQPAEGASYFTFPRAEDLVIRQDWPARRAFNFVRGAEQWPLIIDVGDVSYRIRGAKSYATDHQLDQSHILLADELWVQMRPGVLRVKIWPV